MSAAEAPGVLAGVLFAAIVVLLAMPPGERIRAGAFLVGWILPGAGQILLGRWKKGLFFLVLIAVTYGFGMWLVDFRAVAFDDNPFYYIGQYGCGSMMLLGRLLDRAYIPEELMPSLYDPGLLYVCVAGLLNVVIMLNTLEIPRPAGEPGKGQGGGDGQGAPDEETAPVPEEVP